MALDEKLIDKKINSEIKKYEILKKSFLALYEAESKASKKRLENFDALHKIQEYDNPQLKDIYNDFVNEMKSLEDKRNIHLSKIMDLILPVTEYYPEKLKKTKKSLEELTSVRKTKAKLEKSKNEPKNQNTNDVQRITGEIAKSRSEENKKEIALENEMCQFESERIDDNKFLFLHFINSEMKYHSAALEKMTDLFHKVVAIEPREQLYDFAKKLNIQVDFNELGIDIETYLNEKEKRKKEESDEIKEVYDSVESENLKKNNKKSKIYESQNENEIDTAMIGSQIINEVI